MKLDEKILILSNTHEFAFSCDKDIRTILNYQWKGD